MISKRLIWLAFLAAILICGCSKGVGGTFSDNPLVPDNSRPAVTASVLPADSGADTPRHNLWGYYLMFVNDDHSEITPVPLRNITGHWNILSFLETKPCTNCFKIVPPIKPSGNGTLLIDISIKHPFPNPKLTGFDVRGIAMFSGTSNFPNAKVTTSDRHKGEGSLVNADGFTTLYNPGTIGSGPGGMQGYLKGKLASAAMPTSTLNAFKRFITSNPANTRNAFYAGDTIVAQYEVDMPNGPFVFGYAIDSCWVPPTKNPVTDPMTDFPSSANCPEPWKIEIEQVPQDNGIMDCGGSIKLNIKIYDHQVIGVMDFPRAECPDLFDQGIGVYWVSDENGYSLYETTIYNDKLAAVGPHQCLIYLTDKEDAGQPDWLDLTAYQIVDINVIPFKDFPPVAEANASKTDANACEILDFYAYQSRDGDCGGKDIVKIEWDWNNDGIYDEEGIAPKHWFTTGGTHHVMVRVTDDEGNTDKLDTPLEINVNDNFEVVFPDTNLNSKIRSLIGVSEPNPIMYLSLEPLDTLWAPMGGIQDLTGLNYCHNLVTVNLEWCQIKKIDPMLTLVKMDHLRLADNSNIPSINAVKYMNDLTYLDVSSNWFGDISPLQGKNKMKTLYLNGNGSISDLSPLTGMTQLEDLDLESNNISDLSPLAGKGKLLGLNLRDNNITDVSPIGNLTTLKVLNIAENNISDIGPLISLGNLVEFYAWSNNISSLSAVQPMYALVNVSFVDNPIMNDDLDVFLDKQNFGHIALSSTNITDIQQLVDNPYLSDNGGGPGVEADKIWIEDCALSDNCLDVQIPTLEAKGVGVYH